MQTVPSALQWTVLGRAGGQISEQRGVDRPRPMSVATRQGRQTGSTGTCLPPFPFFLPLFPLDCHDQHLILASPNARFSPIVLHHHAPGITSAACNGRVRDSCTVATPRPQVSPALLPIRRHPALASVKSVARPRVRELSFRSFPSISAASLSFQAPCFLSCLVSFVCLRIPSLDIKTISRI